MMRFSISLACVLVASSCGGAQTDGGTTPETAAVGPGGQQAFNDAEPVSIEVIRFVPEALGRPGMPQVTADKKISLSALRKKISKKHTQVEAQVLASMLWHETKEPEANMKEAADILRKEVEGVGDKADVVTLQMLGAAEAWAGNRDGWAKAYETLVVKFPAEKGVNAWKGWLAFLYMQGERDADAVKLLEGFQANADEPIATYSLAWVKFRQRDFAGAADTIMVAASKFPGGLQGALKRDLLLMSSRAGVGPEKIDAFLQSETPATRADVLSELAEGYRFAGYFDRAAATLEYVITKALPGEQMPRDKLVLYRFRQSDYVARLDQPAQAADYAIQSHQALKGCDKCSPQVVAKVREYLHDLANFYYTTFHHSLDPKYYEPAAKLYAYASELGDAKSAEEKTTLANLKQTKERANPANGKHEKLIMNNVISLRREVAMACYEGVLLKEADLTGSSKIKLVITDKGTVSSVEADPTPGANGLGAVNECLVGRLKGWSFPGQSSSGSTAMTISYNFKARKAAK